METHETGLASVRWFVDYSDSSLAVGPSRIDPRTGKILDADITIGNGWVTLPRRQSREQWPHPMPTMPAATRSAARSGSDFDAHTHAQTHSFLPPRASARPRDIRSGDDANYDFCSYAQSALEEVSFALDLLAMRTGDIMDPKESARIAHAALKDVATHEVGHTLGFRHNFRASTIYTQAQINDSAFTKVNGMGGSVMDYNAYNIAAHSTEPLWAYGADEELFGDLDGMDSQVNQRDVGGDPLEFAQRRIQLSGELFDRLQSRKLAAGEGYGVLTRNSVSGVGQLGRAFDMASKYVGSVVYLRDQAGGNRAPLTPVPADKQHDALKLVTDNLFAANGFNLKPEFVSRLTEPTLGRGYAPPIDRSREVTLPGMQTGVLDRLMSPRVAECIQNSRNKLANPATALTLDELYSTLTRSIWGDAVTEVTPARRALQREDARRLATIIARPGTGTATGDARALHRLTAKNLLARTQVAKGNTRLSAQTRAHLDEITDTLDSALKAQASRTVG